MEKINRIIKEIKENKWIHYIVIVIIGVMLSIPLDYMSITETHDGGLHLLRLIGTSNSLEIGQIPPLIAPYFCSGGGYAMNLFYNPVVTYIPLLIKLFTPTYAIALKLFAGMTIVLSGITMYQFAYNVTKKRLIALFSAIIYIISPYKLGDIYRRFAIGEFTAFIFIPILFSGLYNIFNDDGKKHYLLGIGAVGLLLTHTLTAFYTAIFSAIYVLVNIKKLKDKEVLKKIGVNFAFIILISLFFFAPMFEAKSKAEYAIFDSKIMRSSAENVSDSTLEITKFFEENIENWDDTLFCIGLPILIIFLVTIDVCKYAIKENYKKIYILSLIFSIVCIFMSSKYCPWKVFPEILCKLQYSWRMLGFFNFFFSFVVGVNMYIVMQKIIKKDLIKMFAGMIVIILSVSYTFLLVMQFRTENENKDINFETQILSQKYITHMGINREYLPKRALDLQNTYLMTRDYSKIEILEGNADIAEINIQELQIEAKIETCDKGTVLELPYIYYPGYSVKIEDNGTIDELETFESENGFLSIKIDKDLKNITLTVCYKGTVITYVSYIISFTAIVIFIEYIVMELLISKKKIKVQNSSN